MILVTGATGFLGSELVKQLTQAGKTVRALKRKASKIPSFLPENSIDWFDCDFLDLPTLEEAFEGIEYVYHCAAKVSFNPSDKKLVQKVNPEGTSNVVNLCSAFNIKKLVHVSSVATVGESKNRSLITEKDTWEFNNAQSAYAISKYQSEMEVWRAIAEGLNAIIVNPSVILGKHAGNEGSGQLFETVKKGLNFYTSGSCGFVDVEDVASCIIKLMQSEISGERFIINSENLTYKDLLTEISVGLEVKPPAIAAKAWMLDLAWRSSKIASIFTGKNRGITKDTARSAFIHQEYSNAKIKSAIDVYFKPVRQSIKEICNFLKENKS